MSDDTGVDTSSAMTEQDQILQRGGTIAVVGLSPKPHRDSYRVSAYMQAQGWRIVPINPVAAASGTLILGQQVYGTLTGAAAIEKIDLVNVFRKSEDVPPIADEAVRLGLPALWLQLGIRHDSAVALARAAGMWVVQDKCLMVEHRSSATKG